MDAWHVILAALAGAGWGLAVGWRNARDVAMGRMPETRAPNPPKEPGRALAVPFSGSNARREELTR